MSSDSRTRSFTIDLTIDADEFLRLYRGTARFVLAQARSGQTVRFPASALRPFVGHDGVHGSFRLIVDGDNRLLSIDRA